MNSPIIELTDLTKCYGTKKAVDKLNLKIYPGEIFGLLGPNGAGKTTSILMMLGLTEPSGGLAMVCGYNATRNPLEVKKRVGYLPDNVGFYPDMTAIENLSLIGELNGQKISEAKKSAKEILQIVGLESVADKKAGIFSRGMKQRLGLAEVLIKKPQVIILDEPTLGIDPSGVNEFLELIHKLSKEQNLTVLMSSHHLHQVQRVCDRVGIFVDGKMIIDGPIETLAQKLQMNEGYKTIIQLDEQLPDMEIVNNSFKTISGYKNMDILDNTLHIYSHRDITSEVVKSLVYNNANILAVQRDGYSLDDIYSKYFESKNSEGRKYEK